MLICFLLHSDLGNENFILKIYLKVVKHRTNWIEYLTSQIGFRISLKVHLMQ